MFWADLCDVFVRFLLKVAAGYEEEKLACFVIVEMRRRVWKREIQKSLVVLSARVDLIPVPHETSGRLKARAGKIASS